MMALAARRCARDAHRGLRHIVPLLALVLVLSPFPRAQAQGLECRGAQKPQQVAELMFGRKGGDRIGVSEVAWARFLDREITARFPEGLTVLTGAGQWRDQVSKKIVREASRIVQIVLPGEAEDLLRLNEIVEAYKARFQQQSVAVILHPACVSF
jgi:Protein of unknown function (DUF3574)